ncbi:unnamed protein product [Ectocarpus sp. 6 AP-2014]
MDALEQIFLDFTSFGAGQSGSSEMDSAKFVKLAKDCKLVGKNLSTTDLDLIFTKVKDKTAKKINFDTFVEAVELISEKLGKSKDDVILLIVSAKGPTTGAATVADNVRFHDDKSTFTGVHNNGGPTNIDGHNVDMANQLDRSEGADVRGVKEYQNDSRSSGSSAVPRRSSQGETARRASGGKTTAQRKSSTQDKGRRRLPLPLPPPRASPRPLPPPHASLRLLPHRADQPASARSVPPLSAPTAACRTWSSGSRMCSWLSLPASQRRAETWTAPSSSSSWATAA